jgi:hypothetical protein
LLDHSEAATVPHLHADALRSYSACVYLCGDLEHSARAQEQGLAIYDRLEDEYGRAVMLHRRHQRDGAR